MYHFWFFQFIDEKLVTIDIVCMSMIDNEHYSSLNDTIQQQFYKKHMHWNCCVLDICLQLRNEEYRIHAAREQERELKLRNAQLIHRIVS